MNGKRRSVPVKSYPILKVSFYCLFSGLMTILYIPNLFKQKKLFFEYIKYNSPLRLNYQKSFILKDKLDNKA